jgi:hypothetical protein
MGTDRAAYSIAVGGEGEIIESHRLVSSESGQRVGE